MINEEQVQEEVNRLQGEINKVAVQLLQQNPQGQNLMGQQAALMDLLKGPSNGSVSKETGNEVLEEFSK